MEECGEAGRRRGAWPGEARKVFLFWAAVSCDSRDDDHIQRRRKEQKMPQDWRTLVTASTEETNHETPIDFFGSLLGHRRYGPDQLWDGTTTYTCSGGHSCAR